MSAMIIYPESESASFVTYYQVVRTGGCVQSGGNPPAYCPSVRDVSSSTLYRKLRSPPSDNFCNVGTRLEWPSFLGSVTGYLHLGLCLNSNRPYVRRAIKINVSVRRTHFTKSPVRNTFLVVGAKNLSTRRKTVKTFIYLFKKDSVEALVNFVEYFSISSVLGRGVGRAGPADRAGEKNAAAAGSGKNTAEECAGTRGDPATSSYKTGASQKRKKGPTE